MLKKAKVVMLPTDKKAQVRDIVRVDSDISDYCGGTLFDKGDLIVVSSLQKGLNQEQIGFTTQHLYFIVEDEVKEGEWFLINNEVHCTMMDLEYKGFYKIIASTNIKLNLPTPSTAFLEKYCEKGGIDEVMVEYMSQCNRIKTQHSDYKCTVCNLNTMTDVDPINCYKLPIVKVSSDNTITIRPIKSNWSKEQLPIEQIENLIGYIDTPIGRRKYPEEVLINIKSLKEWLNKI